MLTRLRADAYPLAHWIGTGAQVDPQTHQVRIFVVADSGAHFRFGPLRIEGLSRYRESAVSHLAPFDAGAPYSEKGLLDFQERLAKANLFDSVSVSIEPDESNAAAVPVLVRVREMQAQQALVGIGASADSGPRITLEHLHRSVFGLDWLAKSKIELGRVRRALQFDFTSHAQPAGYRNLLSAEISQEIADDVTTDLQKLRVGRARDTEHIERLYYLEWQEAKTSVGGVPSGAGALTGNYEWVWRSLDSNLLPTRGLGVSLKAGAGRSFIPTGVSGEDAGLFARATGRLTLYQPIGAWYSQSRIEAGAGVRARQRGDPVHAALSCRRRQLGARLLVPIARTAAGAGGRSRRRPRDGHGQHRARPAGAGALSGVVGGCVRRRRQCRC